MLTVSNYSWHMKVYRWWYNFSHDVPFEKRIINLCPYMRAVLIWAPLFAIFGNDFKILGMTTNWLTIPAFLFTIGKLAGFVSYDLKFGLWILFTGLAAAGILIYLIERWKKAKKVKAKDKPEKPKEPSPFWELTKAWFKSAHDNICPIIEIDGLLEETPTQAARRLSLAISSRPEPWCGRDDFAQETGIESRPLTREEKDVVIEEIMTREWPQLCPFDDCAEALPCPKHSVPPDKE